MWGRIFKAGGRKIQILKEGNPKPGEAESKLFSSADRDFSKGCAGPSRRFVTPKLAHLRRDVGRLSEVFRAIQIECGSFQKRPQTASKACTKFHFLSRKIDLSRAYRHRGPKSPFPENSPTLLNI
jgi:hypothetical protein